MSESKTVLFMSEDLAQSTAFKAVQQGTGERPGWLTPFEAFFRELPLVLIGQVAQVLDDTARRWWPRDFVVEPNPGVRGADGTTKNPVPLCQAGRS